MVSPTPAHMVSHEERSTRLLDDQQKFDEKVVGSTVEFYNRLGPMTSGKLGARVNLDAIITPLNWIPPLMEHLPWCEGTSVKWDHGEDLSVILAAHRALTAHMGSPPLGAPVVATRMPRRRKFTEEDWVGEVLANLPIHSRFAWNGGAVTIVSLPLLTNVQRCVAYTLALLKLNKHGLGKRVKGCPLVRREEHTLFPRHLFVATQANQHFCCQRHSNHQRQLDHRARTSKLAKTLL
jgi:hypothetical protein